MSTRGFLGFVIDGAEKITYNHMDSYPSWLGLRVLEWARQAHPGETINAARALRVVDQDAVPTDEDVERLRRYLNENVDTTVTIGGARRTWPSWYQLLRGTQGDPAAILEAGVIIDASDFPSYSLDAEWGYLIDIDTGTLEVYRGWQSKPHNRGRFAGRSSAGRGYYPCALVASWPLLNLPSDEAFLATLAEFGEV
jgi:hypothetical protein